MGQGVDYREQYTDKTIEFFRQYNEWTGRTELYFGYIAGACTRVQTSRNEGVEEIAVDFGCGTGWLTPRLVDLGFDRVVGVDPSRSMLKIAHDETRKDYLDTGKVRYRETVPEKVMGHCSFVSAVHVHYHFEPREELRDGFFGVIASMLSSYGEAVVVGCPSDYVHQTPYHYENCIHKDIVPLEVQEKSSSLDVLADEEGFIPLSRLPPFQLQDGTQMKVNFRIPTEDGGYRGISLTDTFWKDQTLIETAREAGLELVKRLDLGWKNYPHAYTMFHFKKTNGVQPV